MAGHFSDYDSRTLVCYRPVDFEEKTGRYMLLRDCPAFSPCHVNVLERNAGLHVLRFGFFQEGS